MERSAADAARVEAAFTQYEAALLRRDRYEIAAARSRLLELLVATGWDAPQEVQDQLARDRKVLRRQAELDAEPLVELARPATHRQPPRRRRDDALGSER